MSDSDPITRVNAPLEGARVRLRFLVLVVTLLSLGCSSDPVGGDPTGLGPGDLCSDNSGQDIPAFEDADLEAAIRDAVGGSPLEDLTCGQVQPLTALSASGVGIASLTGIENLSGLTDLNLSDNSITDISPLSGLTSLETLDLSENAISNIDALSGLTSLSDLNLHGNPIRVIQPPSRSSIRLGRGATCRWARSRIRS